MSQGYSFVKKVKEENLDLSRKSLKTVQVNLGKKCNQACKHCHVEAGPKRTENMTEKTVDRILELLKKEHSIDLLDLTGGAPELNPYFQKIVTRAREMGIRVMNRCNLTILFERGQEQTAEFLAKNQVEITASLPCYSKENVDQQRGNGVFEKSIEALKIFNQLGYGQPESGLILNLVYNPGGAFLPPDQNSLQRDYQKNLKEWFGISFNHLFTITNMPIKRFLWDLQREKKLEDYMNLLVRSFNPAAAQNVMCRSLISIGYDGQIYDCDFNQMLEIPARFKKTTLWDIESFDSYQSGEIAFRNHCYGCTAGAGSSCGGALE
ncbi:MAG: radical SAM protein [Bdellovibrionaceae bacterium]|nr:radical SAM protein [Pseudobdellovibrionaceae bacterium]